MAVVSRVVVAVGLPVIAVPVGVVRLFRAVAMIPGVTVLVDLVMAAGFVGVKVIGLLAVVILARLVVT